MKSIPQFDLLKSPLSGTNLIEASAGTGKTYNITALFLRLLLEKGLNVEEILVVTYTEAATSELKDRIRNRIREAIGVFAGIAGEDSFLNDLATSGFDLQASVKRLEGALRDFDRSAIFTIHGFCLRVLQENAFESGSLFDTELITDQESLIVEVLEDFWRLHFYDASPLFIKYLQDRGFKFDSLISFLKLSQPGMKVIPKVDCPDTSSIEKQFEDVFEEISTAWPAVRGEVNEILMNHEGLNRNKYRKGSIPTWIESMESFLTMRQPSPLLCRGFEKFTSTELQRGVKSGFEAPAHDFFELCDRLKAVQEELVSAFDKRLLGLKVSLLPYVEKELANRKYKENVYSFDDLLTKLQRALVADGGEELIKAVRSKFRAALIDEFQDTDPIQYFIFKRIFDAPGSVLFLIGDPKQAIYSFRGADIFAYMGAAKRIRSRFTLGKNWRSNAGLIRAINCIFGNARKPFVYDEIRFQPVEPGKVGEEDADASIDNAREAPLQLWFMEQGEEEGDKAISKTQAHTVIAQSVASEIASLVALGRKGKARVGGKPIEPGDIAVLVRKNMQARLVQKALLSLGIPSVLFSTANLFDSHEALEMERLLRGILDPNDERLLRAALATDILGVKGEEMYRLVTDDDASWESWLVKFREYRELWRNSGFIVMIRHLLFAENVLERLMSLPDGERRCTNLLHLVEVLHHQWIEKKLGGNGLVKWLSEQRHPKTRRSDEYQLRLESDEDAVQVVTIHRSKGLEYPIVFCPFTWDGSKIRNSTKPFTFHDENEDNVLTLDLGSNEMDKNRALAERELLAENLRLFYVALTRAKHRCYVVWGKFNQAETSAPAYLFHQSEYEAGDELAAVGEKVLKARSRELFEELKSLEERSAGSISSRRMPAEGGERTAELRFEATLLDVRKFQGMIDQGWRVASFSSLVSNVAKLAELAADRDPILVENGAAYDLLNLEEKVERPADIFSFPKGSAAGLLLHDIFEHLDFREKEASVREHLVADKLREHGFESSWQPAICGMIENVLTAQLDPMQPDFTLSCIANSERLNELEFYFPLKEISKQRLQEIFSSYGHADFSKDFPEQIERLDFSPIKGFMRGFIDMVFRFKERFYLVDWKSNYLGDRPEAYCQEMLVRTMQAHFYILQYHIYAVALHEYLKRRLGGGYDYERHFGGVYYIFLRGIDPSKDSSYGIFYDKPAAGLIDALCAGLLES